MKRIRRFSLIANLLICVVFAAVNSSVAGLELPKNLNLPKPKDVIDKTKNFAKDLDPFNKNSGIRDPLRKIRELSGEALGEISRVAFQQYADLVRRKNANGKRFRISNTDKEALRVVFGNLVNEVTIYENAWLPKGINFTVAGQRYEVAVDSSAQTISTSIFIKSRISSMTDEQRLRLLAHECTHVRQYKKHGSIQNFGYHYIKNYVSSGGRYDSNPYEKEAFTVEKGNDFARIWQAFSFRNSAVTKIINPLKNRPIKYQVFASTRNFPAARWNLINQSSSTIQTVNWVGNRTKLMIYFKNLNGQSRKYTLDNGKTYHFAMINNDIEFKTGTPISNRMVAKPNFNAPNNSSNSSKKINPIPSTPKYTPQIPQYKNYKPSNNNPSGNRPGNNNNNANGNRVPLGVNLKTCPDGVHIVSVKPNSPATRVRNSRTGGQMKLEPGDHIVSVNGNRVNSHTQAINLVNATSRLLKLQVQDKNSGNVYSFEVELR